MYQSVTVAEGRVHENVFMPYFTFIRVDPGSTIFANLEILRIVVSGDDINRAGRDIKRTTKFLAFESYS